MFMWLQLNITLWLMFLKSTNLKLLKGGFFSLHFKTHFERANPYSSLSSIHGMWPDKIWLFEVVLIRFQCAYVTLIDFTWRHLEDVKETLNYNSNFAYKNLLVEICKILWCFWWTGQLISTPWVGALSWPMYVTEGRLR